MILGWVTEFGKYSAVRSQYSVTVGLYKGRHVVLYVRLVRDELKYVILSAWPWPFDFFLYIASEIGGLQHRTLFTTVTAAQNAYDYWRLIVHWFPANISLFYADGISAAAAAASVDAVAFLHHVCPNSRRLPANIRRVFFQAPPIK